MVSFHAGYLCTNTGISLRSCTIWKQYRHRYPINDCIILTIVTPLILCPGYTSDLNIVKNNWKVADIRRRKLQQPVYNSKWCCPDDSLRLNAPVRIIHSLYLWAFTLDGFNNCIQENLTSVIFDEGSQFFAKHIYTAIGGVQEICFNRRGKQSSFDHFK